MDYEKFQDFSLAEKVFEVSNAVYHYPEDGYGLTEQERDALETLLMKMGDHLSGR